MSLGDLMAFAWRALRGHRLRTILTLLGMSIGVGAVVLLTALGEGARGYVTNEFMALGSNLLIVLPGKTETTGNAPILGGTIRPMTLEDCEAIQRRVPRVRRLAPLSVGSARVGYGERRREVTVLGSTPELLPVRHLEIAVGRFLPDVDLDRGAPVAVIGRTVQEELFGGDNPLGQPIRIGDWRFRVVGVMAAKGQSLGLNMDDVVIVPVTSSMRLFNQPSLFRILIEVGAHSEIDQARREVLGVLRERHEGEEDVTVLTQDSVLGAFDRILGALTLALAGIAAISLSVAGIGIMNVMLVSVSERTPEVGLLKALGAPPRQILKVFLIEAIMLSAAGGLLGLLIGYLGSSILSRAFPALPAHPPAWAVSAAVIVSLLAGGLFGVLPARRAARLDPVLALAGR
ncbi:MAG: peptide ABC transporter permease [Acidobacteria bacterium 13_1_40CM_2_68_5]|nr:MAG: peptide ABC transporter permease [Acidobacteria bacterium 13_1_40CM_2_68_5]